MTRSQYQKLREEEENKQREARQQKLGDFLWANFWLDFHAKREGINRPLVETHLEILLKNHGATNVSKSIFGYMSDNDIILSTTELYTYVQLTAEGIQEEYWPKALEQSNPYVLRYQVFSLHNRMYDLMTNHKKVGDKKWEAERKATYTQAKDAIGQIETKGLGKTETLLDKYPAFAHFLLGYSHYTLAIGGSEEHAKTHWENAYKEFLLCEMTESKKPKASFIVNLGQGLYKDMPFDNLDPIKEQIEERLSQEEIFKIRSDVERMAKASPKAG